MCPPVIIPIATALGTSNLAAGLGVAGTAMAAVSAGLGFMGQQQAARAQQSQWHESARLAQEDLRLKQQQMVAREMEERSQFAQQSEEIKRRSARAMGFTQAAAGVSGVYGNTVDVLIQEFGRQQAESLYAVQRNRDMRSRQMNMEMLGMQQAAVSGIRRSAPTTGMPSFISPLLQTAGAGLNYAGMFMGPGLKSSAGPSNPWMPIGLVGGGS
jgi:hypothetical protein